MNIFFTVCMRVHVRVCAYMVKMLVLVWYIYLFLKIIGCIIIRLICIGLSLSYHNIVGAAQCLGELYQHFGRRITSGLLETTMIATKLMKFNEVFHSTLLYLRFSYFILSAKHHIWMWIRLCSEGLKEASSNLLNWNDLLKIVLIKQLVKLTWFY